MEMATRKKDQALINEMSIVDIFTKLIFDADSQLNDCEEIIYQLLIHHEDTLLKASRRDVSEYLRAMGVDEMIKTVAILKAVYEKQQGLLIPSHPRHGPRVHR
jgi:hypothetical protein